MPRRLANPFEKNLPGDLLSQAASLYSAACTADSEDEDQVAERLVAMALELGNIACDHMSRIPPRNPGSCRDNL